jgi:Pentapeptide repeats (8 copies)
VTSNGERRRSIWKWARWLAVAVLVAVIIYLLFWYVPDVLARRHTNPSVESAWIGAVAGFLGVGATAAVAIFAFWYSRSTNQATIEASKATTDKTIDAAREAQFPGRYSTAVEQLGSDNLDVRIGGIYALEGIAAEYARHHPTAMELLAAFIREHSGEPWPPPVPGPGRQPLRTTRPDVQTALTVIGRRDVKHDIRPVDLNRADLTRADLTEANLAGADLSHADLTGADLTGAHLTHADLTAALLTAALLTAADLTGAKLLAAKLTRAGLWGANLTGAYLGSAFLVDARLGSAFLVDADLRRADLSHADLTGADLTGADLDGANLTGATLSEDAPVPEGWVRESSSGRLKQGHPDGDDSGN